MAKTTPAKTPAYKPDDQIVTIGQPGNPPQPGVILEVHAGKPQDTLLVRLVGGRYPVEFRADQVRPV